MGNRANSTAYFYAPSEVARRHLAPILAEIEDFLISAPMGASTLGAKAMGDPRFLWTLRNGRDPSSRVVERVRRFMRGEA